MIRFSRTQTQPIGVDIGTDSVKLLQMETVGQTLSVVAAAQESLPAEAASQPFAQRTAAAADLIRRMLRHNAFSNRRIVAALPSEIVHVKNLRLPLMPMDELRSAIDFEVKNVFPFDTKDAHVQFLHAGEVRQGSDTRQEVIVIASQCSEVDEFVYQLHRSGAVIESLDFAPASIYRSVERFIRRREDEQEVNVLVDVGSAHTQVVIGRGQNISFFKAIEVGALHLHQAIAQKLGITFDEACALRRRLIEAGNGASALAEDSPRDPVRQAVVDATRSIMESLAGEVSLCLRYHSVTFRGHRPSRIRVVGCEASDPYLLSVFNSALPIPAEIGSPLRNVDTSRMRTADRRGLMSGWAAALGLSLKMTTSRFGPHDGKAKNSSAPQSDAANLTEMPDLTTELAGSEPGAAPETEFTEAPIDSLTVERKREVVHA